MQTYTVRYRTPNGSWQETEIRCNPQHNDPWQQAYALFGRENVISVYSTNQDTSKETYIVRYRTLNGSWQETEISLNRQHNDPWQQAYAMFGREKVISVFSKSE
jgi:hypothetical protein